MTGATTVIREIQVDEIARAEAVVLIEEANDRRLGTFTVTLDDGQTLDLPSRLNSFVSDLLESMASGAGISTSVLPEELTTTVAADVIGVSRPTLMKMIRRGTITAHKVGTHHRLRRADVLAVREARQTARKTAANELLRAGEAFD